MGKSRFAILFGLRPVLLVLWGSLGASRHYHLLLLFSGRVGQVEIATHPQQSRVVEESSMARHSTCRLDARVHHAALVPNV